MKPIRGKVIRTLDCEETAINETMRQKIRASLADPRADISAADVFARLRAFHEGRLKASCAAPVERWRKPAATDN
jgi:hypothetical protein